MEVQPDYRDLLALLNAHEVEYLVVGAYALAFHGAPRFTADLDLLVKSDPTNASHILQALDDLGFGSVGLTAEDFQLPHRVVQLGVPPVRVDIFTSLTGVSWDEAYSGRTAGKYGDIEVYFIGRKQFLVNKRALGRKRDLADLEALDED
jgi:hypothetical protein